jgi:GNAT superfamily N-acetyltransferase
VCTHDVRPAEKRDAEAIANLLNQLGYPSNSAEVAARLDRMQDSGGSLVLVAAGDDGIVGLATAHVLTVINRTSDVAWLTALVVDHRVRRHGVGRLLVSAVEAFARQSGCERLSVTTYMERADAQAFYTQVGFELTGRRFGKPLK